MKTRFHRSCVRLQNLAACSLFLLLTKLQTQAPVPLGDGLHASQVPSGKHFAGTMDFFMETGAHDATKASQCIAKELSSTT